MANISSKKRTREITIRLTDDELQQLKERNTETTLARWLRNLGLGMTPIKQADPALVRTLGRIGSNLNQITKHANTHKELDKSVLDEINVIRKVLNELIEKNLQDDEK